MIKIFLYKNFKKILLGIIFFLGLLIAYLKYFPIEERINNSDNTSVFTNCIEKDNQTFYIDIMGQVVNPGVYELNSKTLIIEAIEIAGGFGVNADLEYVHKNILLSANIKPLQKIYIPAIGENMSTYSQSTVSAGSLGNSKLNINTANKEALKTISGVGDVTAEKIIELRPIKSLDQLKELNGVPSKTIDNIILKSEL